MKIAQKSIELKSILYIALFAAIYFVAAKLGLSLASINSSSSPVWPATGVAFFILYKFGRDKWVSIALGAFVANFLTEVSWQAATLIAIGNTLEAVCGVNLIFYFQKFKKRFSYLTSTVSFLLSSIVGCLISASVGATALYIFQALPSEMYVRVWFTWWIGDILGGLVFAPALIKLSAVKFNAKLLARFIGVFIAFALVSHFVFISPLGSPYLFLVFPVLLLSLLVLENEYIYFFSLSICMVGIVATAMGSGPFATGDLNERLIHLQLFLTSIALTVLTMSGCKKENFTKSVSVVLLVCWLLSGALFYSFENGERYKEEQRFDSEVSEIQKNILIRMAAYEEALRGGAGLYAASKSVELDEWKSYFNMVKIMENYPGINGLGVIWPVDLKDISKFEENIREQGLPTFFVHDVPGVDGSPALSFDKKYVIKFIEPIAKNKKASGLNIGSEINRRLAADIARDTNKPTITNVITLVQDKESTPGFLLYIPIYKNGAKIDTIEQRRKSHIGWVYSPFISKNFFGSILMPWKDKIELRIYDGETLDSDRMQYDTFSRDSYKAQTQVIMGQRTFTLEWRRPPNYSTSHNTTIAWVGLAGALASLLLINLMINLQLVNRRSHEIADELTKELRDSREIYKTGERRLSSALEGSNDGIWDWDITNHEMYVSEKIADTFAWDKISKIKSIEDMSKVAHPDDLGAIKNSIEKLLSGESKFHEVKTRYRTRDGDWRWVLSRGRVSEYSETGVPIRITGVHIDIDKIVKTNEALELVRRQLESIANSVPAMVSQWDKNLKLIYGNNSFYDWFQKKDEKITGSTLKDLIGDDVYSFHEDYLNKALLGEAQTFEKETFSRYDGEKRYIVVTYLPDIMNNVVQGIFAFAQDITDLKQAELRALEERRIAIEATEVKSQFLANMSHEIRTPMNGIIGVADLLADTDLTKSQSELVGMINFSADNLLSIINDILDFSKMEAGKMELESINFSFKELMSNIQRSMLLQAQKKKIALMLNCTLSDDSYFYGDPVRIQQVLLNLISNAIKFTDNGGSVEIACKILSNDNRSSKLRIDVSDSGIGIPKSSLSKMFQAFSQADETMNRKFGGTGLGLSISKQLVDLMNGKIGVDSEEGSGSTFWVELDLVNGIMSEGFDLKDDLATKLPSNAKILVVDDNQINQQVTLAMLNKFGCLNTKVLSNGVDAIKELKNEKYDLVLMDCQMPIMDGFETTRRIRASNFKWSNVPIVAMTANAMDEDKKICLESKMNDYISKPFKEKDLLAIIQKNLPAIVKKSKGHILVVEDNLLNQTILCQNLTKMSYTFDVAINGIEALSAIEKCHYDLVLMDCQMPIMDGYEATKKIRQLKNSEKASVPIIAVTANVTDNDREKCFSVGMDDYLTKPLKSNVLAATLKKWTSVVSGRKNERIS